MTKSELENFEGRFADVLSDITDRYDYGRYPSWLVNMYKAHSEMELYIEEYLEEKE
tara:strand:+ start:271 stop:438 length:168 start_codon:yes stop_codon:yes gene_type:complete